MRKSFRDFFYFPKSDRRAIVALGCIAVFCVGVLLVVDSLQNAQTEQQYVMTNAMFRKNGVEQARKDGETEMQCFDPNTVDSVTLVKMGVKPWKVKNFLAYRRAGKVFRSAKDMGNTYGWTEKDEDLLAPYIKISSAFLSNPTVHLSHPTQTKRPQKKEPLYASSKFQTLTVVDANVADSATLCRIPGIGAGIANAILRYRTRLGGFYSTQQLLEIKIFSPELLEWFTLSDHFDLIKIPINQASFQILNAHPYITYDQTRSLLNYIRLYGGIADEDALRFTNIFTAEEVDRLSPYLIFD